LASVFGALVLLIGLALAGGLGLLLYATVTVAVALAVAMPIAVVVLVIGIALLKSGRSLSRWGADAARATHDQALIALTAHRGAVTAAEAARALGVTVSDADAMLTGLAKREPERIAVDIDEHGAVWYRAASPAGQVFDARLRIATDVGVDERSPQGDEPVETEEREKAEIRR
jgi:hypothetical protein